MRIVLWVVLALTTLFAVMNWPAFNTPQPLWLGFATITAPLGVLLLGALVVIALLLLVEQSAALAQSRQMLRQRRLRQPHRLDQRSNVGLTPFHQLAQDHQPALVRQHAKDTRHLRGIGFESRKIKFGMSHNKYPIK